MVGVIAAAVLTPTEVNIPLPPAVPVLEIMCDKATTEYPVGITGILELNFKAPT